MTRDRDDTGRPQQARPRDALGRPLPYGCEGVPPLPEPLPHDPAVAVPLAQTLLDTGRPFQAHEVLEELWRTCPTEQRSMWQGLAQLAVAVTHQLRGNRPGASRLLRRAAANLGRQPAAAPPALDTAVVATWLAGALAADDAGLPIPTDLRLNSADGSVA